jgi:predicted PurR-regulated permease PerM
MLQSVIMATLTYVGLLIIGVEYALLLSVIAAVLNLIPYVGILMASLGTVIIALATADVTTALWVMALFAGVQFIDNNIVVPNVVASRVELNALVSIIVVMIGGAIWGIPGMFLAIPLTAIAKVIFDRVPSLEPFGFVLGSNDGSEKESSSKDKGKKGKD